MLTEYSSNDETDIATINTNPFIDMTSQSNHSEQSQRLSTPSFGIGEEQEEEEEEEDEESKEKTEGSAIPANMGYNDIRENIEERIEDNRKESATVKEKTPILLEETINTKDVYSNYQGKKIKEESKKDNDRKSKKKQIKKKPKPKEKEKEKDKKKEKDKTNWEMTIKDGKEDKKSNDPPIEEVSMFPFTKQYKNQVIHIPATEVKPLPLSVNETKIINDPKPLIKPPSSQYPHHHFFEPPSIILNKINIPKAINKPSPAIQSQSNEPKPSISLSTQEKLQMKMSHNNPLITNTTPIYDLSKSHLKIPHIPPHNHPLINSQCIPSTSLPSQHSYQINSFSVSINPMNPSQLPLLTQNPFTTAHHLPCLPHN